MAHVASVDFWDRNAKWYELWVEHNRYHEMIMDVLTALVKPGWSVLDVGAGSGILSLHCAELGCSVTALEPSPAMRQLLARRMAKRGIASIGICPSRWEDVPLSEVFGHDLIIASNSLHLTTWGFSSALEKVFHANPDHALIVIEKPFLSVSPRRFAYDYVPFFHMQYAVESSFVYHSLDEAFEHWTFRQGRQPDCAERLAILSSLSRDRRHFWMRGSADVCLFWWTRKIAVHDFHAIPKEVCHVYQNSSLSAASHDFGSIC